MCWWIIVGRCVFFSSYLRQRRSFVALSSSEEMHRTSHFTLLQTKVSRQMIHGTSLWEHLCSFFHILLIIEQRMKKQRQTNTHSFTNTLIQNVQRLENHTQVFIVLIIFLFHS